MRFPALRTHLRRQIQKGFSSSERAYAGTRAQMCSYGVWRETNSGHVLPVLECVEEYSAGVLTVEKRAERTYWCGSGRRSPMEERDDVEQERDLDGVGR
jgi:hypothetical protein